MLADNTVHSHTLASMFAVLVLVSSFWPREYSRSSLWDLIIRVVLVWNFTYFYYVRKL